MPNEIVEEEYKTCAWCQHHIWADSLSYHICIVNDDDDHEECGLEETCPKFKNSGRFQNVKRNGKT